MEITNANAGDLLPHISALLDACTYFALDLEFTGLDRDVPAAGANAAKRMQELLCSHPDEMYNEKLEAIKSYSVLQIGISIFTKSAGASAAASKGKDQVRHHLATATKGFRRGAGEGDYTIAFLDETMKRYGGTDGGAWEAMLSFVRQEMTDLLTTVQNAGGQHRPASPSEQLLENDPTTTTELLRRLQFLEAFMRELKRCADEPSAVAATSYDVHTFWAYMCPADRAEAPNLTFKLETVDFLVDNHFDLGRWVKNGLRFMPLEDAAAALSKSAEKKLRDLQQDAQPRPSTLRLTPLLTRQLKSVLPLNLKEEPIVSFAMDLEVLARKNKAYADLAKTYPNVLCPLIRFSRGLDSFGSLPQSLFVPKELYTKELSALASLGLKKANRGYAELKQGSKRGANTAADEETATAWSAVDHYGTALLEAIRYATEVQQKTIVVHSGYTDFMFLLLSICGQSKMPATMKDFKSTVQRWFPSVYDTRVLACSKTLAVEGNYTGKLPDACGAMAKTPSIASQVSLHFNAAVVGGEDPAVSAAAHNAGFDAMLAGKLFAYAEVGFGKAMESVARYKGFLASYNTLRSISVGRDTACVLPGEKEEVYFMEKAEWRHVDTVRQALLSEKLPALVVFRTVGFTIHPIGESLNQSDFKREAEKALSGSTSSPVTLVPLIIYR